MPLMPPPLVIQIDVPKTVRSGEPFHVVARLVNRSEKPIVIAKPSLRRHEFGLDLDGDLLRDGKPVAVTSGRPKFFQSGGSVTVGPCAFQTLAPGESVTIEDTEYRREFAEGKIPPGKRNLQTAPTVDFSAGQYTLRFAYAFERRAERQGHKGFRAPRFSPEGKRLYDKAWVGKVEAETAITVVAA